MLNETRRGEKMETRILGRTGLRVSVMGVGAGGSSQWGKRDAKLSQQESVAMLLRALDSGVNFIDTAEAYGTEGIVGAAISQRDRSQLVISSKKRLGKEKISPAQLRAGLHESLRRLGTDCIDVYHLHGLRLQEYDYYLNEIMPCLHELQREGKIRFIGVTEHWNADLQHKMLQRALADGVWDVIMVGFNLLNQSARHTVLQPALASNIGVLIMFAIRLALSKPDRLRETIKQLVASGEIDARDFDLENPLAFLKESDAATIPDAAYRFCRDEPGAHVILSGTGNPRHLEANLATFARGSLPAEHTVRLKRIFRRVRSVTGQ
ncbi:MAG: aldo/keto reductase [Chloroflexi bacterium]|nr:aldo/keto reductase [Chloroflexota bacterium]